MFDLPQIMQLAQMKARHSAARQAIIAQNVAHADTPGYAPRDITPFSEIHARAFDMKATRESHLTPARAVAASTVATAETAPRSPNGNAVSLEREMLRAFETRHDHDLALGIYASARNVLRTSLGR